MDIFNTAPGAPVIDGVKADQNIMLFVQYNRDENKRFPEALYHFHQAWRKNKNLELWIVGNFTPELVEYGFDLFAGEPYRYFPPSSDPHYMAQIMRSAGTLLFPAFMDASPNTVLEARACGMKIDLVNPVGGTIELVDPNLDISLDRMCAEYDGVLKLLE
jgi:hypothetical protein